MKRITCILFLVMTCILSCHKNDNPNIFTKDSYPLAVGDWWQYQMYSVTFATDSFILRIDSMYDMGAYKKYICNYIGNGTSVPAGYFLQSDTSLYFIDPSPYAYFSSIQNFQLRFPAASGTHWPGNFPGDSIKVLGVNNLYSSYGHNYSPCYSINESYNLPHNFKVSSMLLTPKVGLIYQSIDFNSDTAEGGVQLNQSITLIDYHVQ